jgi:hypothetical protein
MRAQLVETSLGVVMPDAHSARSADSVAFAGHLPPPT